MIKYRVVDKSGKVRGLSESKKSAYKYADKLESGGKYEMNVEKIK